jgi:dephospho-CoA kinase
MGRRRKLLICTSGLPGSGKGVILEAAKRLKVPYMVMGDIVRRETEKRGLAPNPINTGRTMLEYRKKYGKDFFGRLAAEETEKVGADVVLVDGVRNLEEVEYFRSRNWSVVIIVTLAAPSLRYKRLRRRKRMDDVESYEGFIARDERELSVGIDRVILYADHYIVNQNKVKEEVVEEALALLKEILKGRK